jgi:outer membrane protein TolC
VALLSWSGSAFAEEFAPVRLRVGGRDAALSRAPVADKQEVYAPLEVLALVGAEGQARGEKVIVTRPGAPAEPLPLKKVQGQPMLPLSALADLLNAEVRRLGPADPEETGASAPETVYLLARLLEARYTDGTLRIVTSFPVPTILQAGSGPVVGYVECYGAVVTPTFQPEPLPTESGLRLRVEPAGLEGVRVLLETTGSQPPTSEAPALSPLPERPPSPELLAKNRQADLQLETFLQRVDAFYPKLRGADAERRSASAKRLEKQGAFDPTLPIGAVYQQYNSSSTRGKRLTTTDYEFRVEVLTPYGAKVALVGDLNYGAVKSPGSSTGLGGTYSLEFKLPLLRGAGINEKLAAERQARLGEPLADQVYTGTRLDVLLEAAANYWEWAAAGRRVQVQRELLEVARARAQGLREQADAGDVPPIQAVEAESEVQLRQGALTKAEQDFQKAALKVALYLWDTAGNPAPLTKLPDFLPVPTELTPEQIRLGRQLALERRPELKNLSIQRDIAKVSLALAKNQRQPAVDLVYAPGVDTGDLGVGEVMKAGIVVEIPLRTRGADGRIQDAELKLEKIGQEETLARQTILNEVETAALNVNLTYRRYLAAEQELELARVVEEGDRVRLTKGDISLFQLNLRERATALAAIKVIETQAEYQQALAAFRAATAQF